MSINYLVNIGLTALYYEYIGEFNNGPTIVFESGYGWSLDNWRPIKDNISDFANVFMYDRDGIGKSGCSNQPKHSLQIIENLRLLLQKAQIKPPYIFVGHSFGGVNVRLFANNYPEEVTGVILLDSVHEDQNKKMVSLFTDEVQQVYLQQFVVEASLKEFEESLEQVRGTNLKNIPLIVMTGGTQHYHTQASMALWMDFQKELTELSTISKHIIVEEAGHAIHQDRPDDVIDAISEMVDIHKK